MTIQDIQIIVIQMMIPVQIQVVVIVAAMIKKLVPLWKEVRVKRMIKVGQTRSFGCPAMQ